MPVTCHKNPEMGREDRNADVSSPKQNVAVWVSGNGVLMKAADVLARKMPKKPH